MFSDDDLKAISKTGRSEHHSPDALVCALLADLIIQQRQTQILLAVLPESIQRAKAEDMPQPGALLEKKPAIVVKKKSK